LSLGKAALALAQWKIGSDQARQTQGSVGSGNAQQTGVGTSGLLQWSRIQDEGRLVEQR